MGYGAPGGTAIAGAQNAHRGAVSPDFPHRRGTAGFRRIVLALFAGALATFTVLYSVQALLPALAADFAISPAVASLALSVSTGALAVGVIPLTSVSELYGRIPVMTVALFAAGVLAVATPLSPNFATLLALRALLGLAAGRAAGHGDVVPRGGDP